MKPSLRDEATRAVDGALSVGIGQGVNVVVGVVMAMLVPRLLGAADYGNWVLYRSVATLVVGLSALGTAEVVGRFYMPRAAGGDAHGAGRIFKGVVAVRAAATAAAALVGFGLIVRSSGALSSVADGLLLAASIGLQGMQAAFLLLLYGNGRLRPVALIQVLGSATVPLAVLLAHSAGGLRWVPAGCAIGDAATAILTVSLARPARAWVKGWLGLREYAAMFAVGGVLAASNAARDLLNSLVPYLMLLRSYGVEAIGYVGLAARVGMLAFFSLSMVGAALFPALVQVHETEGLARAQRWSDLASRLGTALLGLIIGAFLLLGRWLVPPVFGAEYRDATPVLAVTLCAVIPLWLAGQWARLAMLTRQTLAYPAAAAGLLIGYAACFYGLPADRAGLNAAWSLLAGASLYALTFAACLQPKLPARLVGIRPLLLPLLLVGACWPLSRLAASWPVAAGLTIAWAAAYALGMLLGGSVRPHEIADILRALRRRG